MREKLERINGALFTALEQHEAMSMIGGAETKGQTGAPTMIGAFKDVTIDITDDPPVT